MDPKLARRAWTLRQMLHGALGFDPEKLAELPSVVQALRAIVAGELKSAFGIARDELPVVVADVPSIHPSLGVQGHGAITESDLSWPA